VKELADKLAAESPTALRMGLAAYHHQADRRLEESLPYLRDQLFALLGTEDAREGLMAFLEKRPPVWKGR
jgi:enoyl-CoA hydratase/carnithine racemase